MKRNSANYKSGRNHGDEPDLRVKGNIDFAALGYAGIRDAFNETLRLFVAKLTKAEIGLAQDILDVSPLDQDAFQVVEMVADTALYSSKQTGGVRKPRRAIDRIAPKLAHLHDPLKVALAARLPAAFFSIFQLERGQEPDSVLARDMLASGASIVIMDTLLSARVAELGDLPVAGRFVDLGPWHVGFGIVLPLRKSEVVALSLALAGAEDRDAARSNLHELIYPAKLHGEDLVMTALEPMITAMALAIDADLIDVDDAVADLSPLFSGQFHGDDEDEAITRKFSPVGEKATIPNLGKP